MLFETGGLGLGLARTLENLEVYVKHDDGVTEWGTHMPLATAFLFWQQRY